jgi:hypothetical protein
MESGKIAVIFAHAFVIWVTVMGIGMMIISIDNTSTGSLLLYISTPIVISALVTTIYFRWFGYTSPLKTAAIFVFTTILLDLLIVAMIIMRNIDIFYSALDTWIPFLFIFITSYLAGMLFKRADRATGLDRKSEKFNNYLLTHKLAAIVFLIVIISLVAIFIWFMFTSACDPAFTKTPTSWWHYFFTPFCG